jgi:V/A-type H+-transporting ATPase subunit E
MQGKEAIINKIISESEAVARGIISHAEEKKDILLAEAKALAENYEKKKKQSIEREAEAIINRKISAAEIEVKKMLLFKRQEIIDKLFSSLKENIKKDKAKYKTFLKSLVEKYCENNDTVVVSESDVDIFSEKDVNETAKNKGISLKYATSKNIDGGILLVSSYYDKNFSLSSLFRQIKEENITQIDTLLFGEK